MSDADTLTALEQRLSQLEAIDAIKSLKHRYLMACDTKQPELMRNCFAEGEVLIDYGPAGQFSHRDQLVDVFTEVGCHPHMLEMHHAHNPLIELLSGEEARGSWELCYQLVNTRDKTLTQLALIYRDRYRRIDGDWKIVETVTENISSLVFDISAEQPRLQHAG